MAQPHELRCYDYVNHPYATVRDALRDHLGAILERATKGATGRAEALAAGLKVDVGPLEIGTDVAIELIGMEESEEGAIGRSPTMFIRLRWKAGRAAALFPSMDAELVVYPLSRDETQLELRQRRPRKGAEFVVTLKALPTMADDLRRTDDRPASDACPTRRG